MTKEKQQSKSLENQNMKKNNYMESDKLRMS